MADGTDNQEQNQNDNQNTEDNKGNPTDNSNVDNDIVKKLVAEQVETSLKEIKGKLDKAYNARDEALLKVAEFERKAKEEQINKLKEEGKFKEAYEQQLAEEKARREALEKANIELTRDIELKSVLSTLEFRSDKASEMAYREIVGQLVRNEQGVWVHKSGVSMKDFAKVFSEDDSNSFLFKVKQSSGSGSSSNRSASSSDNQQKSLFQMSQDDVLKMAREGKLRK